MHYQDLPLTGIKILHMSPLVKGKLRQKSTASDNYLKAISL